MKKLKKIPNFRTEKEEREFWIANDSTDYLDWEHAKPAVFPNLKPATTSINIRMSVILLDRIKILANRADVPYQSYMKMLLADKVAEKSRNIS